LLYLNDNKGLKFHSVVIVLDRLSLNLQIGSAVETFLRRNGIDEVAKAKSVQNLMELLLHENSKQLMIITTIQKLIHLSRNKVLMSKVMHRNKKGSIDQQTYCRIALLVDEAHRSHGDSTRNMVESFFENVRGTNTFLSVSSIKVPRFPSSYLPH
jgi:type I site-specific restriction-modification system R (restriction) subunit